MRTFRGLLGVSLIAWLAGCNSSQPTSLTSPSVQGPASHMVSGTVSEIVDGVSQPLAGHPVVLWIQEASTGRSQLARTDHNGRYSARVPTSRVFASSFDPPETEQPCLASAAVDKDTTLDVQIARPGSSSTPSAASPMITGFVYETTAQGRSPLRGVSVSLGANLDLFVGVAWTRTDDAGRFVLCRVNTPVRLEVSAVGYSTSFSQLIPGTANMALEIELRR